MVIKSNKYVYGIILFISFNFILCGESVEKKKRINDIIGKSGLEKQYFSFPDMIEKYMSIKKDSLDKSEYIKIRTILKEKYKSKDIIDSIRDSFENNYNDKYISEIEKFYQTSLAKKITNIEIQCSRPEFASKVLKIKMNSLKRDRVEIIKELMDVAKILESNVLVEQNTFEGFVDNYNALVSEKKKISNETKQLIKQNIKSGGYSKEYKDTMIIWTYMMYENLRDEEIEEYLKFIDGDAGHWMRDVITEGIIAGVKKCTSKGI